MLGWNHFQIVHMKSYQPQNAICLGQVALKHPFQILHFASLPGIMILWREVSHLKEHGNWRDFVRFLKDARSCLHHPGVEFVLPIIVDRDVVHLFLSEFREHPTRVSAFGGRSGCPGSYDVTSVAARTNIRQQVQWKWPTR